MKWTRSAFRLVITAVLAGGIACDARLAFSQETGGTAALQHLRDGDLEKALDALGPVAEGRTQLPENETDAALPAAAGGLFRALAQEDADLRFDLLSKWTLPDGDRKSVRLLTATARASGC
jgi:hypothetical protein